MYGARRPFADQSRTSTGDTRSMEITSGGTAAPRLASVFAVRDNNVYGSLSGDMRRQSGLRLGRQRLYQRQGPLDVAARAEARSPVGGSMAAVLK